MLQSADLLRDVYDRTAGVDGYVSLEVRPTLAMDTEGTIVEARRLFKTLDRPNIMIKVPATPQGIPAIKTLIADGININVTLIFSIKQYESVAEAYLAGLEDRLASGKDASLVASVASFFVSRVDTAVDRESEENWQLLFTRKNRHRQFKSSLPPISPDIQQQALGDIKIIRRTGSASVVGQHQHQESCLSGYLIRG